MSLPPPPTGSETPDGVAHQSEGVARLSVLRAVRQGVSTRRAGVGLRRCRANGGAPGVDGQTFEDIETYGVGRWLDELAEDLRKRTYSAYNGASPPLQSRKNSAYNAYAGFLFRCYSRPV